MLDLLFIEYKVELNFLEVGNCLFDRQHSWCHPTVGGTSGILSSHYPKHYHYHYHYQQDIKHTFFSLSFFIIIISRL